MIKSDIFKDPIDILYVFESSGIVVVFIAIFKYEVHLSRIAIDLNYQRNEFSFQYLNKFLEKNSINKSVFLVLKYSNILGLKL